MRPEVLEAALRGCGATVLGESAQAAGAGEAITALDLYETGLSGRDNSARLRQSFLREHKLPEHLSSKALVQVLNTLMTREEFYCAAEALSPSEEGEEKP
jgi:ribonuclease M5